jgi:hypothetical protein
MEEEASGMFGRERCRFRADRAPVGRGCKLRSI